MARKRTNTSRLVLILGGLLAASPMQAAPLTGAELLQRCGAYEKSSSGTALSADEAMDAMWCMGYVSGLLDGFGVSDFRIGETRAVCPPEAGLTRMEAVGFIIRWLREHPEEHAKSGRRAAVLALTKAMPCRGQSDQLTPLSP